MVCAVQDGTGIVALRNMSVDLENMQMELPINGESESLSLGFDRNNGVDSLDEMCHLELENARLRTANEGMTRLVEAIQQLSLARSLDRVMEIVRTTARELTGADGATFVLRDGDCCYYADENAIAPLWKGQKFPMKICISGWVMMNRQSVVIEDIYQDPRIPADAYRPTFVKSLAMVPIRTESPIGAIGNYWASRHVPSAEQIELLQALANTTSVAMENVRVYEELEERVKSRTAQLEAANKELESFSYAVSHDLRAPLRAVRMFSKMLVEQSGDKLDKDGKELLGHICSAEREMQDLIEGLLQLSRCSRVVLDTRRVELTKLGREVWGNLAHSQPNRQSELIVQEGMFANVDEGLMKAVLENLLGNAWKYSSKTAEARIEFFSERRADVGQVYCVKDNGAGFEMEYVDKLFQPFQRLHSTEEFPGTGIGLATVRRIIERHGGRIWAEGAPGKGAAFWFTVS
jgi:signal transduction histidine kinase